MKYTIETTENGCVETIVFNDTKKFFSKFTKEEIIETLLDTIPETMINDILRELYHTKIDKLLGIHAALLNQLEEETTNIAKSFEILKKINKISKETDLLFQMEKKFQDALEARFEGSDLDEDIEDTGKYLF